MQIENIVDPQHYQVETVTGNDPGPGFAVVDESLCEGETIGRAHYERAKWCAAQGDASGAIAAYETAVMYVPAFAEAHSNLGNLYLQSGRRDEALRAYETAIGVKPDLAPLYCNLAAVLIDLERCDEAIAALETALRLAPDLHEAHANLCRAYRRSGRDREALEPALRATELRPDRDVFLDVGEAAFHLGAYDVALEAYQRALALDAACAKTHCNLGAVYQATRCHAKAIAAAEAAIALQPDFAVAHCNLGAAYQSAGRYAEAINAAQAAIAVQPNFALAHCNLGALYHLTGRHAEAIEALEAAIALQPGLALAHFNLALPLLIRGDLARGWNEYVWLWSIPEQRSKYAYLDRLPLWNGQAFVGRQLLITADEGFGDAIQLARYLPAAKARGGRVILEVRAPLATLFATVPGVDEVHLTVDGAQVTHDADLQIPLSGLPRACSDNSGSIPTSIPYLQALPERVARWRPRLQRSERLRVGIVWAGNPDHANDLRRSVRLEDFASLGGIPGIAWFGLQKGRDEERRSCGSLTLEPLGPQIGDFADTAAIVSELDLVIAVDTSVVHLAGALGKPVWTLLPFAADWRWLLARDDSPWYPTMRLFRQPAAGDWASVFADIARALRAFEPATLMLSRDISFACAQPADALSSACAALEESVCELATIGRAHNERARVRAAQGDVSGAILAYETVVAYAPDFAEAHSNLGNLYLQSGRLDDALRAYETAIRAEPELAPLYCNRAAVLIGLDRCDEAVAALKTTLRLAPNLYEAHANLCQAYRRSGRDREALAPAQRATELRPNPDAFVELGVAAFHLAEFDRALAAYQQALALDPTCAKAHCNLAAVHHVAGRHAEAIAAGEAATALQPDFVLAHCNLAAGYHLTGRYTEAIAACEAALAVQPDFALAHCNLGVSYHSTGRYAEARAAFGAAIALQPDFALAHFNLALALLVCGDFARGWDEYVWLWRVPDQRAQYPYLDRLPIWNGEEFPNRRLLITADAGFGDAIQLVRYLPAVKARGGRVVLEVKTALMALFADVPGIDELRVRTDSADFADDVDLHIPLSGLPRAFASDLGSIPTSVPYLRARPERIEHWRPRLEVPARLRVGLVWAGNPRHANDCRRSVQLDDFALLAEIEDIAWFGLQKGRDEECRSCGPFTVDPLGSEIGDFADTAAIVAQLDLVIAVDTAVAHLAGALGTPVWTLLPFAADWRWLLERADSPWYPTMRLFRQPSAGDWSSVFAQVARELRMFEADAREPSEGASLERSQLADDRGPACAVIDEKTCEASTVARTHYDRAKACAAQGDASGAIVAYQAAVAYAPDFAEAHSNLGTLYLQSGRRDDALRAYETAIRVKPDLAPLYCNLAAVHIDLGQYDEAMAALQTALRLAPELQEAHANLCQVLRRSGRDREALAPALRALELRPSPAAAYFELGNAALHLEAFEIANDAYRRTLELDATCAGAHSNLSVVHHGTGRHAQAVAAGEAAIALQPDFALAHVNLGMSLLMGGDFARGWDEYVWAWRAPEYRDRYPHLDRLPLWSGETFAGRRLLVTSDQGFGDAIQFARYLSAVKARGGRVVLDVPFALVALLADVPGVDEFRVHPGSADSLDAMDLQIPLSGLPRAFGTDLGSIPAAVPYLRAQPDRLERWRPRLDHSARLRVGIIWAGSPAPRNRSVRLEDFAGLGEIEGIAWYGLQKGCDEDRRSCGSLTLDPLGADIRDFADTAAIITQLDLVIAIDTAAGHLAGALGKPVWTLLQFAADWRWLIARDDSPWYPTMRLFRQPAIGDWTTVFAEVARALRTFEPPAGPSCEIVSPAQAHRAACAVVEEAAVSKRASIGRAYHDHAGSCAARGDLSGAISAYEMAIAYAPEFAEAHSDLGNAYVQSGRSEDALRAYQAAIRAKPDLAPLHCNLGLLQIELGRFQEAIASLESALRYAPDLYEAHASLSQAYRRSGRDRDALEPAKRAVELRPQRDAFLELGVAAFNVDAFDLATDAYEQALALDPTCAEAHSNLGWLYHLTGRLAQAIAACEAAIAVRPDFAAAHDNLGVIYQSAGRHVEAIVAAQAAIALQPAFASAHRNLAVAFHSLRRYEEAIDACQTAIALQPAVVSAHANLAAICLGRPLFGSDCGR